MKAQIRTILLALFASLQTQAQTPKLLWDIAFDLTGQTPSSIHSSMPYNFSHAGDDLIFSAQQKDSTARNLFVFNLKTGAKKMLPAPTAYEFYGTGNRNGDKAFYFTMGSPGGSCWAVTAENAEVLFADEPVDQFFTVPHFFSQNGKTHFFANGQLFQTDGTAAGTTAVLDIEIPFPANFLPADTGFIFREQVTEGTWGYFWYWKRFNVQAAFEPLQPTFSGDISGYYKNQYTEPSSSGGYEFALAGGRLVTSYKSQHNNITDFSWTELDGYPRSNVLGEVSLDAQRAFLVNNKTVWSAMPGQQFSQFFQAPAPHLILEIHPVGNNALMVLENYNTQQRKVWTTYGTANSSGPLDSLPPNCKYANFMKVKNALLFTGFDGQKTVFWQSNGTTTGTKPFAVFDRAAPQFTNDMNFFLTGDTLFFSADDGLNGQELWMLDVSSVGANLPSSVGENPSPETFSVFPNPAVDWLNLDLPEVGGSLKTTVFDATGRCVFSGDIFDKRLNLSGLAAGFYFLKIENGGRAGVVRFVKTGF